MVIGNNAQSDGRLLLTGDEAGTLTGDEAGTPPGDRKFRPDVQGMRAIAIFLALVYHAGIPGFSGGYVGIEVFFVISGFVITGLLLREREGTGRTSLRSFYGRRVRRIMPAATLVIIAAVIASYALLGPLTGNQTANDGQWASVFLINIHFAANGTNYLSSLLPPSVIENYWSLAVEEQFYIVYPTLFLLIGWWARKGSGSFRARLTIVLVAVIIASYAFSITDTLSDAQGAYFSLLTRSWELALGALIAVHGRYFQRIPQAWAAVASWAGLAVIMVASVTLTGSSRYPGALVAIPTLAAGLVIAAGAAQPEWGVERLLRRTSFQFVAAISFPLYLWHWPILEIAAQSRGVTRLPVWDNIGLLLMAGVLATLTYYLFENPIRHNKFLATRRWASLVLGACLIASSLTFTTVAIHLHDEGALATPGLANLATGAACPAPTDQALTTLMGTGPRASHRTVARILLVGDSTACTMVPGLEAVGAPVGVRIENAAVIGCGVVSGEVAPLIINGRNLSSGSRLCQSRANAAEAKALRSGRPNIVLWASTWERSSLAVGSGSHQKVLTAGSPQWYAVLRERMEERVGQLTASGATVVMLREPPNVDLGKPGGPTPRDEAFERLNALLTQFAAHTPHVRVIDLASYVCPSGPPCPLIVDGLDPRGDGAHYTSDGSLWVARWLMPQLGIAALDKPNNPLPAMTMLKPASGTVLKGTRLLVAIPSFNVGVAKVTFEITGNSLHNAEIGNALFAHGFRYLYWNTTSVPDATYTVRSVAYNVAGGDSVSKGITVRVSN
jgi:peptidoglycan/LPS O-acetylase OafA/YrhL